MQQPYCCGDKRDPAHMARPATKTSQDQGHQAPEKKTIDQVNDNICSLEWPRISRPVIRVYQESQQCKWPACRTRVTAEDKPFECFPVNDATVITQRLDRAEIIKQKRPIKPGPVREDHCAQNSNPGCDDCQSRCIARQLVPIQRHKLC